jgi:beta-glucosidase
MNSWLNIIYIIFLLLTSCTSPSNQPTLVSSISPKIPTSQPVCKVDRQLSIEKNISRLISCMTLDEKIGQMTQIEKNSIQPGDISKYFIGSILSGGGGSPSTNTPEEWYKMTSSFQDEAHSTRLAIPLIYSADAVHGHGNLFGATIFPQQIGLGAANDPDLMRKIGKATASEMLATGVTWNFAPVVAVPQDIRWGRTYEAYSENTEWVSTLASAYLSGLQSLPDGSANDPWKSISVLATPSISSAMEEPRLVLPQE